MRNYDKRMIFRANILAFGGILALGLPSLGTAHAQDANVEPGNVETMQIEEPVDQAANDVGTPAAAPAAKPAPHTPEGSNIFIPAPPEGKGQIVFYRPGGMGFAMGCTVFQGDQKKRTKITSVGDGRYAIVVAEPGKQTYWVKNEKKDAITLLVEEGETQYVRCSIKMGLLSGRPDIAPSTAEEFVKKGQKTKLVNDDDMGEGALRAADIEALK